jgi:hypothetical protein
MVFQAVEWPAESADRGCTCQRSYPLIRSSDRSELELGETHDALWNSGQRELVRTGQMHNIVRMLWGKSVLTWTRSYAGIQWCFGKFDRPFQDRPVCGTIRPMSLERAHGKYDVERYLERWAEKSPTQDSMALAPSRIHVPSCVQTPPFAPEALR